MKSCVIIILSARISSTSHQCTRIDILFKSVCLSAAVAYRRAILTMNHFFNLAIGRDVCKSLRSEKFLQSHRSRAVPTQSSSYSRIVLYNLCVSILFAFMVKTILLPSFANH
jgi:thiazole synthase ThiGH ThiG subunit